MTEGNEIQRYWCLYEFAGMYRASNGPDSDVPIRHVVQRLSVVYLVLWLLIRLGVAYASSILEWNLTGIATGYY